MVVVVLLLRRTNCELAVLAGGEGRVMVVLVTEERVLVVVVMVRHGRVVVIVTEGWVVMVMGDGGRERVSGEDGERWVRYGEVVDSEVMADSEDKVDRTGDVDH